MANNSRQHGSPLLINSFEESATVLEPVDLTKLSFQEDYLQALLAKHPQILPIAEIEPDFAPPICLGREIPTPSGFLDTLYVSPSGNLTLVEAKLWRNPQARREVVGQIIDYAKDFSKWTFEELDRAVRKAGSEKIGILDIVRTQDPDIVEASFIDNITRRLRRGELLLLIVGDGIREGVENISHFLQDQPGLHFSLSLIELAFYRIPGQEWPLVAQPRTVLRTTQITRAVVEVRTFSSNIEFSVEQPKHEVSNKPSKGRSLTEEGFFQKLAVSTSEDISNQTKQLIDRLIDLGLVSEWGASGVSMRLPDPRGLGKRYSLLFITSNGFFWVAYLSAISDRGGYNKSYWMKYLGRVKEITGIKNYKDKEDETTKGQVATLLLRQEDIIDSVEELVGNLRYESDQN